MLAQEREDRDKQARMRAGAEAEIERLRGIKNDRDLKILHLQMQIIEAERSKIELEIAGIESQLMRLGDQTTQPASPPDGGQ